jgi:uroporphyrin-3 C-methyltransferase
MQIANAQLQLAANPELASMALTQADDRLAQIGDPALLEVRRALANEQAALEVMEKPDIAGVALTLASLARVVDSLPLRQSSPERDASGAGDAADAGGVQRAWGAVKGAVSGLVTYTPPNDADAPLLTPDAEPLIRSNLALQLQAARLALLRGEQELFEQSLDDSDQWLAHYFDASAEPVRSARDTLTEIKGDYRKVAAPDISASLRLLRQYQTLADGQQ